MKFLVPSYSCLQNPWLRGYRPQIPVLSVLCPQPNLLNPSEKKSWVRHWFREPTHQPRGLIRRIQSRKVKTILLNWEITKGRKPWTLMFTNTETLMYFSITGLPLQLARDGHLRRSGGDWLYLEFDRSQQTLLHRPLHGHHHVLRRDVSASAIQSQDTRHDSLCAGGVLHKQKEPCVPLRRNSHGTTAGGKLLPTCSGTFKSWK